MSAETEVARQKKRLTLHEMLFETSQSWNVTDRVIGSIINTKDVLQSPGWLVLERGSMSNGRVLCVL